jgi:AcrR family transcriptional regulator
VSARLPAPRRRRQLLDVALEVFAEQGFHATSMNDIAEAAGVSKPVLYQHFRSKRELYLELLEDVGGRLRDTIGKATSDAGGPRQQVEAGFRAYFLFVSEHRAAFRLLFGGGSRRDLEFAEEVRRVEDSIADAIAALIDVPGLAEGHRQFLAYGIVGLAEATSRRWLGGGVEGDAETLAATAADLAWAGLRGVRGR